VDVASIDFLWICNEGEWLMVLRMWMMSLSSKKKFNSQSHNCFTLVLYLLCMKSFSQKLYSVPKRNVYPIIVIIVIKADNICIFARIYIYMYQIYLSCRLMFVHIIVLCVKTMPLSVHVLSYILYQCTKFLFINFITNLYFFRLTIFSETYSFCFGFCEKWRNNHSCEFII